MRLRRRPLLPISGWMDVRLWMAACCECRRIRVVIYFQNMTPAISQGTSMNIYYLVFFFPKKKSNFTVWLLNLFLLLQKCLLSIKMRKPGAGDDCVSGPLCLSFWEEGRLGPCRISGAFCSATARDAASQLSCGGWDGWAEQPQHRKPLLGQASPP